MMNQTIGFVTMTEHQMRIERVNHGAWMTATRSSKSIAEVAERLPRIGLTTVLGRIRALLDTWTLALMR